MPLLSDCPEYDERFSASIGGYPKGCIVRSNVKPGYWQSEADDNISNPDAGGAYWLFIPTLEVLAQG